MANFVCFLAARAAKAGLGRARARNRRRWRREAPRLRLGRDAHLDSEGRRPGGLGTESIRWIPTDAKLRMDVAALRRQIDADRAAGDLPFIVVGTAGSVSTGAVDPLPDDRRGLQRIWRSGFTSTAPMAVSLRRCPTRPTTCAA